MFASVGSLRVKRRSARRVELSLSRITRAVGLVMVLAFAIGALALLPFSMMLSAVSAGCGLFGLLVASSQRDLTFDLDDGVLHVVQGVLGLRTRRSIPLFQLRAVVVAARGERGYVAYLQKRVGAAIELDDGARAAPLLALAKAIAEVTELRMIYRAA